MSNKLKVILIVSLAALIISAAFYGSYWIKKEKQSFTREKEACLNRFTGTKLEDLLKADRFQATAFISCQAVKENDAGKCDWLKDDELAVESCREMADIYLKFVYPLFEKKDCSSGSWDSDDKNMCNGMLLNNVEDCERMSESLAGKTICLAVAQDEISVCDQAKNNNEKNGCRDFYYFAKAAKKGDFSYLDKVESGTGLAIYKLFFNRNLSCVDLLSLSNKKYCDVVFSEEAWGKRILGRD